MEDLHSFKIFEELKENNVIIYNPKFKFIDIFSYNFIEKLLGDKKICVIADDIVSLHILYCKIKNQNFSVYLYISNRNKPSTIDIIKRNLKAQVIILTSRRLLNILRLGILKLCDISHLLIQGSHRTYKNSALKLIMNEFYLREPEDNRSRILSTTPVLLSNIKYKDIKNKEVINKRLNDLKKSLQSVVLYPETKIFYSNPINIKIYSRRIDKTVNVINFKELKSSKLNKLFMKWLLELEMCYFELGFYAYRKHIEMIESLIHKEKTKVDSVDTRLCSYFKSYSNEIFQSAIDLFESEFSKYKNGEPLLLKRSNVSVKFRLLRRILAKELSIAKERGYRFIGLLIINSKVLSQYLCDMINQLEFGNFIIFDLASDSYEKFQMVLNDNKNILIISTRVAFENFDIPINCAIDYDAIRTIDEHCLALSKLEEDGKYYSLTSNYQKKELMIKNIKKLHSIILKNDLKSFDREVNNNDFIYKCGNATHSYFSAVDSFHNYIVQLPDSKYFKFPLFSYSRDKDKWNCKINFRLPVPLNNINSLGNSKKEAKQLFCFKVMKRLYEDYNIVNQYFMPKSKRELNLFNQGDITYQSRKTRLYKLICPTVLCANYEEDEKILIGYVYQIEISKEDSVQTQDGVSLGIILPKKLHSSYSIQIHLKDESKINVRVKYIKKKEIKKSKRQIIHDFHVWAVLHSDLRQKNNIQLNEFLNKKYFLCLIKDKKIDFELMTLVPNISKYVEKLTPLNDVFSKDDEFKDKYLYMVDNNEHDPIYRFVSSNVKNQATLITSKNCWLEPYRSMNHNQKYLHNELIRAKDISQFYLFPLDEDLMENLEYISIIMSYVEGYSRSQQLTHDVIGAPLPYKISYQCLTAKSTNQKNHYDKFEFLGDCYLKLLTCVFIAVNYPNYTKKDATLLKSNIVSNSTLFSCAQKINLGKYINIKEWSWWPTCFEKNANYTSEIKDKTVSDCFEALLGAYRKYGSKEAVDKFLMKTGLQYLIINHIDNQSVNSIDEDILGKLEEVESIIGYTFNCKEYLLSSLMHSTYKKYENISTYDRFQQVGDAIIDYFVTFQYLEKYEFLTSGDATIIRSHLSHRAIKTYHFIRLGLYKYVFENRGIPVDRIRDYESLISQKNEIDYLTSLDYPSYFDFLSSILGAIYIDSNLNEEKTFRVFDNIYSELFKKIVEDKLEKLKPPSSNFKEKFIENYPDRKPIIKQSVLKIPRTFYCSIKNNEELLSSAVASNKNAAMRIASYLSLEKI